MALQELLTEDLRDADSAKYLAASEEEDELEEDDVDEDDDDMDDDDEDDEDEEEVEEV